MQDYSRIYISGMVLTNTGITPHSHNLKQFKNAPGMFSQRVYSCQKQNATPYILFVLRSILKERCGFYLEGVSDCEELVGSIKILKITPPQLSKTVK